MPVLSGDINAAKVAILGKSANDNSVDGEQPRKPTMVQWKEQVKAGIAAGKITAACIIDDKSEEINADARVTDVKGRVWIYLGKTETGKDLLVAEEDHKLKSGREIFNHEEALEAAKAAGASLMNLGTSLISYRAFRNGLLKGFRTDDRSYWLAERYDYFYAVTRWFGYGTQDDNNRNSKHRVRFALEI